MMYKVGDKVVVKSYDDIKETLKDGNLTMLEMHEASGIDRLYFSPHMKYFCNKTYTIAEINAPDDIELEGYPQWTFCRAWLRPEKLDNRRIDNV